LPALAWGEARQDGAHAPAQRGQTEAAAIPDAGTSAASLPQSPLLALIVGGEPIADALTEEGESAFECERTEHPGGGLGLARALAPDVVIVDADLKGALDLVESLLDDPLTEPVPILVLGDFRTPDQGSRFVALGVAKTLAKPVSPSVLQRACQDVIDQREGRTVRVTLGEPTVEQLGDRLAEEVRRALVDTVDQAARRARVPLGEGSEVLGAVWGAIARVREVITMRTDGAVRYTGDGPEGAVAMAPWLHQEVAGSDRSSRRGRGAAADVSLDKRVVIVADDDPGVTWFIADLLRATGCVVHEALDGKTALELAYKHSPQLIVSDILMPGLDGFALCRAIRRDVALRDVPVILLSWKEDLLQRVRELGASAAAYLRKESDARAIVARVREVLRSRARIEARLQGEGEVRGRLDDLSVHSLLELVCAMRPSSRVSIRDASFLYEVEIRGGSPRRATRTAGDGSFRRGERVIASMLGVGAGRFIVAPSASSLPAGDLRGTLQEQLDRPIRLAREAILATTGTRTANVDQVVLDEEAVAGYLLATPQPARDVIKRIAEGSSPRAMLVKGEVAPALLEDVLSDLASRGAILAVRGPLGDDLLDPSVDRDLDSAAKIHPAPGATPTPASEAVAREVPEAVPGARTSSSLEDAVMHAMSDGSRAAAEPSSIVEAAALRPRHAVPSEPAPGTADGEEEETAEEEGASPGAAREPEAAREVTRETAKAAEASIERSIPIPMDMSEQPPRAIERSNTAPSVERARRAAAASQAGHAPSPGVALSPKENRGWGILTVLLVLGVAGAAGTYWCGSQASTPDPDPASKTP
jgi:DNA-binding response OmpR family regulator